MALSRHLLNPPELLTRARHPFDHAACLSAQLTEPSCAGQQLVGTITPNGW